MYPYTRKRALFDFSCRRTPPRARHECDRPAERRDRQSSIEQASNVALARSLDVATPQFDCLVVLERRRRDDVLVRVTRAAQHHIYNNVKYTCTCTLVDQIELIPLLLIEVFMLGN